MLFSEYYLLKHYFICQVFMIYYKLIVKQCYSCSTKASYNANFVQSINDRQQNMMFTNILWIMW